MSYLKSHNTVRMPKPSKKGMLAGASASTNWLIPVSSTAPPAMPGTIPQNPPPNMPIQNPAQVGAADPLTSTILFVNTNPYIIGLFMLLLNLGGRFLSMELTKKQEEFLQSRWLRPFLFFTVIFIATRNLAAAFWVTILFFLIVWVIANENSPYCMIPSWCGHNIDVAKQNYEQNINKLFG